MKTLFIVMLIVACGLAENCSDNPETNPITIVEDSLKVSTTVVPEPIDYFKDGDILNPDYACTDTLVVVDSYHLNKAIGYIEQGLIEGTDDNIDSIFHRFCVVKGSNIEL